MGGWRGVQIGDVWRIGRHLRAGAASRLEMYGGMDATYGLGRRPDWRCMADWTPVGGWRGFRFEVQGGMDANGWLAWRPDWGCMTDWTPVGCRRGVQICGCRADWTPVGVGAASRLGLYGGLDAPYGRGRRPDSWSLLIWTPVGCRRGVQIWDLGRNGRQEKTEAASRLRL